MKLYNRTHPDVNLEENEPIFHDYYRPSNDQKIGEILCCNIEDAWSEIKQKYPKVDPLKAPFTARIDQYGRIIVRYNCQGGKYHLLFNADGELNEKLPMTIKKFLGPLAEQYVETLKSEITKLQAEIDDFNKRKTDKTLNERQRETMDHQINEREGQITELEREVEEIEQRMTLRDRIKAIF